MAMKQKKTTVWVVMHYEYMFNEHIDSVQFHVSSSLRKAEKYISESGVMPCSWWQVHPYVVDYNDFWDDGKPEVHYYSHTGKPLRVAPFKRALAAYRRHLERERQAEEKQKKQKKPSSKTRNTSRFRTISCHIAPTGQE